MSIWSEIEDRSSGDVIRKEDDIYIGNVENANLEKDEQYEIKRLLKELYDVLMWSEFLSIKKGMGRIVELSSEQKTYADFFSARGKKDDNNSDVSEEIQAINILGEYYLEEYYPGQKYVFKDDAIILYIDSIKEAAIKENAPGIKGNPPYLTVIRYVYLHEFMHAFFHQKDGYKYNREQEEGLAEFGALFLLDQLVSKEEASKEELDWAVRHVESKKGALECYARGAYLFKQFGHDKDSSKKMLEEYPKYIPL